MKVRKLLSMLLVITLLVGILTIGVSATTTTYSGYIDPETKSGASYEMTDSLIKLTAPAGYEGTETIYSFPTNGETVANVSWTVKGDTGILSVENCKLQQAICIDGGGQIKEAVIELGSNLFLHPGYAPNPPVQEPYGIRVTGANLTIRGKDGNVAGLDLSKDCTLNDVGAGFAYGIWVEDGSFTIEDATVDIYTGAYEQHGINKAYGIFVPNGDITTSIGTELTVMGTVNGLKSNFIYAGGDIVIDGGARIETGNQQFGIDRVIDGSSIRFGYGLVLISREKKYISRLFSVEPTFVSPDHTVESASRGETEYYVYKYTGNPVVTRFEFNGYDGKYTFNAGEDFDIENVTALVRYSDEHIEYVMASKQMMSIALDANKQVGVTGLLGGYTVVNGRNLQPGTTSVIIQYGDFAITVPVTVNLKPGTTPTLKFIDVPENAWYYNDVMTSVEKGLFNGKTSTTFAPNDNMTVGEAVKLAACMHQLHKDGKVTLTNGSPWYTTYMKYAVDNGITADLTSRVGETITRQEYVSIFYKALPESEYAGKNTIADNAVSDVKMDNPYAKEIYAFYRAGIVTGGDGNAFKPETNIQRCEVAAILVRMMDKDARKTVKV